MVDFFHRLPFWRETPLFMICEVIDMNIIRTEKAPGAIGPYSQATPWAVSSSPPARSR